MSGPKETHRKGATVAILIILAFLFLVPLWAPKMWLHMSIQVLIVSLFAMSLNMILGRSGLPSFGHAAFYAVGGYTLALFVVKLKVPLILGMAAAPIAAALLAVPIGYFSVRLSGIHFAILTMGFSQIVWAVAHKWYSVTGGDDGITGIPIPPAIQGAKPYYYLVLIVLCACLFLIRIIQDSAFGQTIVATRENRDRVTFSGLKVWHHQLINFVIAGFFAGIAGSLLTILNRAVFPEFGYWTTSASVVLMCILGGVGVFIGPLVGAAIITLLEHYISLYTYYWQFVLGLLIILLVLFMPGGISGFFKDRFKQPTVTDH
jgi:branched-chain amino acid transport system permease protein